MKSQAPVRLLLGAIVLSSTLFPAAAADVVDLDEVLLRFDEVQNSIVTLSADFTETTESVLLTDTISARGRVYLTKPDSVRWEYTTPEEMRFVIANDKYTGYFPKQKRAEEREIHRWREQLFRFLGLGQASAELAKFYDITLEQPDDAPAGALLLVLEPKKRRVRKRMDPVHFWIDAATYLPVRVEYRSRNGNNRTIDFDGMVVNPELAASLYTVEIPADVTVTKGFSALSGFAASANN